ncbi:MAG: fold metallo-hydrolase [Friedmanniella sp.]|nr:fold metallo-hydrolase [Friedmanniella sp.]
MRPVTEPARRWSRELAGRVVGGWRERAAPAGDEVTRADLRLVPVALAALAATWLCTGGGRTGWWVFSLATAATFGVALLRRSPVWWATTLVLLAFGVTAAAHAYALHHGPLARLAAAQAVVGVELEVRGDPRAHAAEGPRPAYVTLPARVLSLEGRGGAWRLRSPVLVVAGGSGPAWSGLLVGSRVRVSGRLQPPQPGDGLVAVVRVASDPVLVAEPAAGLRLVERVRRGLRRAVQARGEEARALVPALVLGDTSAVTPRLTQDFQTTGLTHLTAVSGANLTLLLAFVLSLARWAGCRGRPLRVLGLLGVVAFVGLCRTEPSVLRAAAMGLVALAALGTGGRGAGVRQLCVAVLGLLLLDPYLSRSLGFQLSVLASGGIIWWARPWSRLLHRWLPLVVAESVAVPLAAHLVTVPLVASISGQVSVSGLAANAVAGPFVGPATVLGFAAAGASLASPGLAALLGFGAAWCAQAIITVAHLGAALPGSAWRAPPQPGVSAWLSLVCLAVGLAMRSVLARPGLTLLLVTVMVGALVIAPRQPGWPPAGWVLVACDVGQGDGLLLASGPRTAVVVDTGPDPAALDRCLDQLGIRAVPLVVLTHFHADHVDGLAAVLGSRAVGQIWVTGLASPAYEARAVQDLADGRGVPVVRPAPGVVAAVGDVGLQVLGPLPHLTTGEDGSSVENDASVVMLATVHGVRVLLTGDVEPPGQAALLGAGLDLRADVLKIPHHGSARQDPAFFAASHAQVAVASAGLHNDYGHPAPRTMALARSLGMLTVATSEHGSVAVTAGPGGLRVVTQR